MAEAPPLAGHLARELADARGRTLALVADLLEEQLRVPRLPIVNPILWELGHIGWFQERWVLRHAAARPPARADGDLLWDSARVAHETRWDLPLPSREDTLAYMRRVLDEVLERLEEREPAPRESYFHRLALFHEDMHGEALAYTRQTLGLPRPTCARERPAAASGPWEGDVPVPGGTFRLGAERGEEFVFDNEKWAHEVALAPFWIARAPVSQGEFAEFVEAGGYRRSALWTRAGLAWLARERPEHPVYWRREGTGGWLRREFDRWLPLEPHQPVLHVNAFEAEAYCRWRGRRLPTEAEWEAAAVGCPGESGAALSRSKRRFPWGDEPPAPERALLDLRCASCLDAAALSAGDSAFGCRQMIGGAWEWTASPFLPYPGFSPDPYVEYSEPWFGTHRVLRGGSLATRARFLRASLRNFHTPDRRDVFAGFRTAAV